MTVQCIACQHFSYQNAPRQIASDGGYGHCAFDPACRFSSAIYEHHCPKFKAADKETVDKRHAWRDERQAKFAREVLKNDHS
ncbi:hypothetical protein [Eoetvoesiella caeni]|uniref:Uncharacterized protein n=1 Tax=Eoetvoesiella caeni TaxID=645616 RepID=A0A366HBY9_9BURK|nr:hypothetical protein [Eoetvoesiella caeni]MCI2809372.1 hypothetical protein [Eoetvoesiella caeni]NYT54513.1 hypothetical protein [Eoetvoesiella caeni]RBP39297.1 hypothetical protein DFR37_10589 [Eoetvoesiella caeni]